MTQQPEVIYQTEGPIASIILNRPMVANAINPRFTEQFLGKVRQAAADPAVQVVVLAANGKHFCAGAELSDEIAQVNIEDFLNQLCKPLVLTLAGMDKPVISAVNGSAAGIGAAFALACDLCIMAEDAQLYFAFSDLSLVPDGGISWQLVNQLGSKRAYQLIAEGGRLNAAECLQLGLCNSTVSPDQLHAEALQWAHDLAARAPLSLRLGKRALHAAAQGSTLAESISIEATLQRQCQSSEDFREAIKAFGEKRQPQFKGC